MTNFTIFSAYNQAKKKLKAAGIESYGFECREIIRHITGYNNAQIMSRYNEPLTPMQLTVYNNIIDRRVNRYPLQYLLGRWSFYGLDFFVGEGVLAPRPDTEILVDTALDFLKEKTAARVLDLCSGSGCVAVAIAKNSESTVDAIEKYDEAFEYLEKNISALEADVKAIKADVTEFETYSKYDLIVSNPPYISAHGMKEISPETVFEPKTALFGGEDGLDFYRVIAERYVPLLNPDGMLAVEVGFDQAESVCEIFRRNSLENIDTRKDYSGIRRVVFGTVKSI